VCTSPGDAFAASRAALSSPLESSSRPTIASMSHAVCAIVRRLVLLCPPARHTTCSLIVAVTHSSFLLDSFCTAMPMPTLWPRPSSVSSTPAPMWILPMSKQQHILTGTVCGGAKNGTGDSGSGVDCTMIERVEVVSHLNQLGRWSRALSWYEMLQSPPPPRANMLVGSPGGSTAEKGNS
jgi:hypothetical protein